MTDNIYQAITLPPVLTGRVRIEVVLGAPASHDAFDRLSELVRQVLELADLGAYVVPTAHPCDASCRILEERRTPESIVWECESRVVDWRIAQILRNALIMFTQVHFPIAGLSVSAHAATPAISGTLPPLDARPIQETYPPVFLGLQIPVHTTVPETCRGGRRAEITFINPPADEEVRRVIRYLDLWGAASFAAYASSEGEAWSGDATIFDVTADVADDSTVEVAIERFGAPEIAWSSLLNLCGRIDAEIGRISRVAIQ